jgi:cytoskeleton protein RodZ
MPPGAVVLIGALLTVGAYIGWYRLSGEGRLPDEVVPAVPSRLAPLAEQVVAPFVEPTAVPAAVKTSVVAVDIPEPADAPQNPTISPSAAALSVGSRSAVMGRFQ